MGKYRPTRKEKMQKKVYQLAANNAVLQMAQLYSAPFKIRFGFCMKLLFKIKGKNKGQSGV